MKKKLTPLTGIVFIIAILVAGSCQNSNKQSGSAIDENDSTRVIYLKEILIDGRMHLEMYNAKDSLNIVIDSLITDVQPGYTVIWKKAKGSKIQEVHDIRPVKEDGKIFIKDATEDKKRNLLKYEIPSDALPGTEKYEIVFTVKDSGTWCIDPFLRIP